MKSLVAKEEKKRRKGTRGEETRGDEYRPFLANEVLDGIFCFLGWSRGWNRDDSLLLRGIVRRRFGLVITGGVIIGVRYHGALRNTGNIKCESIVRK